MQDIQERLRIKGYKATPQRIAIYNILASTTEHPTVEEIYERVREKFPTVSLNTVYKTLLTLKEVGLARRLDVGEDFARYDANPNPHTHLVCTRCSRVQDVDEYIDEQVCNLMEQTACHSDYMVENWDVYIYGVCSKCAGNIYKDDNG